MTRRDFLGNLGKAAVTVALAPTILKALPKAVPRPPEPEFRLEPYAYSAEVEVEAIAPPKRGLWNQSSIDSGETARVFNQLVNKNYEQLIRVRGCRRA